MTFVAFKEKDMEESERREKEQQENVASLGASLPIAFLKGGSLYKLNWLFFLTPCN